MIKKGIILVVSLIAIISCNCNPENLRDIQDMAFGDIFAEQLNGLDIRKLPIPPAPPDSTFVSQKDSVFFTDPRKFLVIVNDSIQSPTISNNIEEDFVLYSAKKIESINYSTIKKYSFKFKTYLHDTINIKVLPEKEFKKNKNHYKKNFYFGSSLTFSGITFNKTKRKGFFTLNINCGSLCNSTVLIFIEKKDLEWKVTKSRTLTIS